MPTEFPAFPKLVPAAAGEVLSLGAKHSHQVSMSAHLFIFFLRFRCTLSALRGSRPLCSSSQSWRVAGGIQNTLRTT